MLAVIAATHPDRAPEYSIVHPLDLIARPSAALGGLAQQLVTKPPGCRGSNVSVANRSSVLLQRTIDLRQRGIDHATIENRDSGVGQILDRIQAALQPIQERVPGDWVTE